VRADIHEEGLLLGQ